MAKVNYEGAEQFRPLSPWAYFGYTILFSIPIVGFVFLIIYSVNDSNINRRNFARSYWCVFVIAVIAVVIMAVTGIGAGIVDSAKSGSLMIC